MGRKIKNVLNYAGLGVVLVVFAILLANNHRYNITEQVITLDSSTLKDGIYESKDVSVQILTRGGDSGAWMKDPILDENGNELHGASVGIIYDVSIFNNTKNIVKDWKLTIPINEMMWLNNNWDSKIEMHQSVGANEKVAVADLSDYSEYDMDLDYYIDHTGPMIPMYPGDYFTYLPEEIAKEVPIPATKSVELGKGAAGFGFIVYIPDQTIDYVADFSGSEMRYTMYENPVNQVWFWVIVSLIFVWCICNIIAIAVRFNTEKLIRQQEIQKKHDQKMVKQTMQLIVNLIENKDANTKGHSLRVARYARMLAYRMGMNEDEAMDVYYIGLMHDCGKINIPDEVLKNPGRLTEAEYKTMKKHTVYGGDILKDFTSIDDIDVGAKYHHERYDGTGYPSGLKGEEIPLIARIICVADALDAMNSKRCYRDKLPAEEILSELRENRGKQFDPVILDHMLDLIEEGKVEL